MSVRIVLVDDHQIMREGLKQLLETEDGFQVIALAGTAVEGVKAILGTRPDIAVIDLSLPDHSGQWIIERVREKLSIPLLVLSMVVDRNQVMDVLEAGANGYLTKAVDRPTLIQAVRTLLSGEDFLEPKITSAVLQAVRRRQGEDSLTLSEREIEVLKAVAAGHSNPAIADSMHLSLSTVKAHVRSVFHKLGVTSRTEAVVKGMELGLVGAASERR